MKAISVLLLFFAIILPLTISKDSMYEAQKDKEKLQSQYAEDLQAAVDDAGAYLARFESQQTTTSIRYQREKQINLDMDMLNIFFDNLALKYGIENNPVAIENLKVHMPAMVMFRYDGYVMITLEDTANVNGVSELEPVFWPIRPYTYTLENGNLLYFTLDDQATVYDKNMNAFYEGDFYELQAQTNLLPLKDISAFREVRQITITKTVEGDLAGAINRHLEMTKRMDLNIQFSLPRSIEEQSMQDVGFMTFIQGFPMSNGELFNGYAFGGSSVMQRSAYIGTISNTGRHVAYGEGCVPANLTQIETLYDDEEAVKKGYFIEDCFKP